MQFLIKWFYNLELHLIIFICSDMVQEVENLTGYQNLAFFAFQVQFWFYGLKHAEINITFLEECLLRVAVVEDHLQNACEKLMVQFNSFGDSEGHLLNYLNQVSFELFFNAGGVFFSENIQFWDYFIGQHEVHVLVVADLYHSLFYFFVETLPVGFSFVAFLVFWSFDDMRLTQKCFVVSSELFIIFCVFGHDFRVLEDLAEVFWNEWF